MASECDTRFELYSLVIEEDFKKLQTLVERFHSEDCEQGHSVHKYITSTSKNLQKLIDELNSDSMRKSVIKSEYQFKLNELMFDYKNICHALL